MKRKSLFSYVVAPLATFCLFLAPLALSAQTPTSASGGDAHTVITVSPKNAKDTAPAVTAANLQVKVDGKEASVTSLSHFAGSKPNLELVLLIDDSARTSLGLYLKELSSFINGLPPSTAISVAYIQNGAAHMEQPFTMNHAMAAQSLHLPGSPAGANADPYFAITSLAKSWPSQQRGVRREVVLVSDGVDPYYGLRFDPENPYVTGATREAQKAGVIIYSIYYKDQGRADRFGAAINSGQNYLIQMSEATGGQLYYEGFNNPVSFVPFLDEIARNLQNQYELGLTVPEKVKDGFQSLKVKVNVPDSKTLSPDRIFVGAEGETR